MPVDRIQMELERIIDNRLNDDDSPCMPVSESCTCSLCCASRALSLRKKEMQRTTTIIPPKRVRNEKKG